MTFLIKKIIALLCTLLLPGGVSIPVAKTVQEMPIATPVIYDLEQSMVAQDSASGARFVKNRLVVFFKSDATEQARRQAVAKVGGEKIGEIPGIDQWQLDVEARDLQELESLCDTLNALPCVERAFYDIPVQVQTNDVTLPDDPWGGASWDVDYPAAYNWSMEAVGAPIAWNYQSYFHPVTVGVVDEGIDLTHEDLQGVITPLNPDSNEANYHGTCVAGIMGAVANNKKGVTGLLWEGADILSYDALQTGFTTDQTFTSILAGFTACVENGAKVVNCSLGNYVSEAGFLPDATVNQHAQMTAQYMKKLLEKGYDFIAVQSSGNGTASTHTSIDAIYNGFFASITDDNTGLDAAWAKEINDRILIVGAAENLMEHTYQQAYYSNAGSQVDLCAPGHNVYSTYYTAGKVNQYKGGQQGTSFAAPMVTATAALVWGINPDLTAAQVRGIIIDPANMPYTVADNTGLKHPLKDTYQLLNTGLCVQAAVNSLPSDSQPVLEFTSTKCYLDEETNMIFGLPGALDEWELEGYLSVTDGSYTLALPDQANYVATGSVLTLLNAAGEPTDAYTIVILGDINGDGAVDLGDTSFHKALTAGLVVIEEGSPYLYAADLNRDGWVDIGDTVIMRAVTAGLMVL